MITIVNDTGKAWPHRPSDRAQFLSGKFQLIIDGIKCRWFSSAGRLYYSANVSETTVTDEVNGGTFTYANSNSGAVQLFAKLISLQYPGIERQVSSGGGGTSIYVWDGFWDGNDIDTLATGLSNITILNLNDPNSIPTFTYTGTVISITGGAEAGQHLTIIANQ